MNIQRVQTHMMHKRALTNPFASLAKGVTTAAETTAGAGKDIALWLLGAAFVGGGAIGAFGAHIMAHGKQDEDTVKKEYENERLKADVGYVSSRLTDENERAKNAVKPKAARVLNV